MVREVSASLSHPRRAGTRLALVLQVSAVPLANALEHGRGRSEEASLSEPGSLALAGTLLSTAPVRLVRVLLLKKLKTDRFCFPGGVK